VRPCPGRPDLPQKEKRQNRFPRVKKGRGWHRQLVAGVATQQEVSQPGAVIGAPTD